VSGLLLAIIEIRVRRSTKVAFCDQRKSRLAG
jgi:hypothetical protein